MRMTPRPRNFRPFASVVGFVALTILGSWVAYWEIEFITRWSETWEPGWRLISIYFIMILLVGLSTILSRRFRPAKKRLKPLERLERPSFVFPSSPVFLAPGAYLVWIYPFTWWIYAIHVLIFAMFSAYFLAFANRLDAESLPPKRADR